MGDDAAQAVADLACALSVESADHVARLMAAGASPSRIAAVAGNASARDALHRVRSADGAELALALRAASVAHRRARDEQRVSLVWSGPDSPGSTMRRAEHALLQVIDDARSHLLVVTYAVYAIDSVIAALTAAVDRGVSVTIVAETPTASDHQVAFDPATQLGDAASGIRILTWSRDMRPTAKSGALAKVHAKCAAADDAVLLVSSSNLTPHGLGLNLELGVLVRGGSEPREVRQRFEQLASEGVLQLI